MILALVGSKRLKTDETKIFSRARCAAVVNQPHHGYIYGNEKAIPS